MRNCSCIIAEHAAKGDEWHKEAINGVQMRLACIKMASWEKKKACKVQQRQIKVAFTAHFLVGKTEIQRLNDPAGAAKQLQLH